MSMTPKKANLHMAIAAAETRVLAAAASVTEHLLGQHEVTTPHTVDSSWRTRDTT
jgi:hypothetical protein